MINELEHPWPDGPLASVWANPPVRPHAKPEGWMPDLRNQAAHLRQAVHFLSHGKTVIKMLQLEHLKLDGVVQRQKKKKKILASSSTDSRFLKMPKHGLERSSPCSSFPNDTAIDRTAKIYAKCIRTILV